MITYRQGSAEIFSSIFRVHGSPLYRAILPSLVSTSILLILEFCSLEPTSNLATRWFQHPYPITCMIVAFTFLLTFKCSFSYNRYWEACTAIHQMHSKWLDVGMELAAFHLQSERFKEIKPPCFGEHPHIDHVVRRRHRVRGMTPNKLKEVLEEQEIQQDGVDNILNNLENKVTKPASFWRRRRHRKKLKNEGGQSVNWSDDTDNRSFASTNLYKFEDKNSKRSSSYADSNTIFNTTSYDPSSSLAAGVYTSKSIFKLETESNNNIDSGSKSKRPGMPSRISSVPDLSGGMSDQTPPSLFLQEATHLLSLLSAVAFATLRNDIETAESPLEEYSPGAPWPPVDPDAKDAGVKSGENLQPSYFVSSIQYMFCIVRTPAQRTVYNACRPFKVLGGTSDAEIQLLQRAKGPSAKTALCSMWLQEFMIREFLNGSLGATSPPIVSRLFQYTSDGMIGYNQARKVAYVPFPFPHSQLTSFYLIVVTMFMPILMMTFVPALIVAAILNTLAVGVFFGELLITIQDFFNYGLIGKRRLNLLLSFFMLGLWLVANELEDPFRNVPNDLPLNNFQAQFNEALVCMFAGFHPEAWWDIDDTKQESSSIGTNIIANNGQSVNSDLSGKISSLQSIHEIESEDTMHLDECLSSRQSND